MRVLVIVISHLVIYQDHTGQAIFHQQSNNNQYKLIWDSFTDKIVTLLSIIDIQMQSTLQLVLQSCIILLIKFTTLLQA